jgi:hypothetical protein
LVHPGGIVRLVGSRIAASVLVVAGRVFDALGERLFTPRGRANLDALGAIGVNIAGVDFATLIKTSYS